MQEFYNETFLNAQKQLDHVARMMNLDTGIHGGSYLQVRGNR